jgi:hypothetical protein
LFLVKNTRITLKTKKEYAIAELWKLLELNKRLYRL